MAGELGWSFRWVSSEGNDFNRDYGVVQAIYRALAAVGRPPHEIAFVSGIGCSSRIPGYTTAYGFNSVHGRALPIAQGIKLANPQLLVLVAGPDVVRLAPSLVISLDEILEGLSRLETALNNALA